MVGEGVLKKYIWVGITVLIGLTAFLGYEIKNVRFDYDFEKFFPANDEETDFFFEHRAKFLSDNDFLLIAIENKNGVFEKNFLKDVDRFSERLSKIKDVLYVSSVTNQDEYFLFQGGATASKPYVDFNDFDPQRDSSRIYKNAELVNTLIAPDGKSVCIFLKHEDYISKKRSDALIEQFYAIASDFDFEQIRASGRTIGQKYYIDKMTFEMALFIGLSVFLIIFFLVLAFRSLWGVIIPQFIIAGAMIWVVGGMGLFDQPMNLVLSTLPSIMFVVSMSDVIHLVSRYLDALRVEEKVYDAISVAVREVGLATLLTSLTTAIGFFSLVFVRVQPIQAFGVVMGCGVIIAFVLTFASLPLLFYLFPGPKHIREERKEHFWKAHLRWLFVRIIRRRKMVVGISSIIIVLCGIGMSLIVTNNLLMDDLKDTEQMKKDITFLENNYGGIRPFELAVEVVDTSKTVWDLEILQYLDTVEQYLEENYDARVKGSLVTMLKVINRGAHVGNPDYFKLPTSKRKLRTYRRNLRIAGKGEVIRTMVDSTEKRTRISGGMKDIGNIVVSKKNEALKLFIKSLNIDDKLKFQLTGTGHLIDKNMKYLAASLIRGLGVSILIVALIIGLIYRSGSILIISIVTNLIPLIFIAGVMGYLGIELKTSTSIIFTIAFGIAVDDTIHFLGKFKHELLKGKSKLFALKSTYETTGKAMILTTLILCSGFLLLVFSSFMGTYHMGVLLCITLFVALIADLTILPVMLYYFYKPRRSGKRKY